MVDVFIRSGYPFELAGLVYFLFYIRMSRGRNAARFSQRSKIFTLIASIVLVGSVPFGYAAQPVAVVLMLALVAIALYSTLGRPPHAARAVALQPMWQTSSLLPSGSSKKTA